MSSVPLLSVDNLTVGFTVEGKEITVVDHIKFSLREAETLAVVGESGSGKTVTALSVLKLISSPPGKITGGALLFRQKDGNVLDLAQCDEHAMQKIRGKDMSMIFQEPMTSLNPVFTCGDQVSESIRIHKGLRKKQAREQVLDLFREVVLPNPERIYRSYPHEISGGQKQRVMIAMAIACNPAILIADEPTTALDVTVQKAILALLKKLQESRKMSILFITHDLGLVAGFADRVMVMHRGKVVEEGPVGEIFHSPTQPYTKGLIACRPPLDKRPVRLATVESYLNGEPVDPAGIISTAEREKEHCRLYSQEPLLKVEKLGKRFGMFTALEQTSFSVFAGETLGIVGESGSGKTTLARVTLELIPPSEGRIWYRNREITCLAARKLKELRKDLQIIFQDPYSSLNPRITVGEAIMEPMKVHRLHGNDKTRKEKAVEMLVNVGLKPEHYSRYPHEFSGGQRQRICIARALATEPRLVICDESVSALDVSVQAQVLNLLNDLKRIFGLTYIFISHDLSVVKFMSDRLIVMQNGRIVEMGEADKLYADPKSDYTRELLRAIQVVK